MICSKRNKKSGLSGKLDYFTHVHKSWLLHLFEDSEEFKGILLKVKFPFKPLYFYTFMPSYLI